MHRFMKKCFYLFGLVFLFAYSNIIAQNYVTHKVKKGETIYSIAKQYNLSPFNIYKLNPDSKQGIQENAVLVIPIDGDVDSITITEREFVGYKKHKVKRKETLYSLANKYNVSQDEIKKHNERLYSEPLRKGDRIQIPIFKTIKKLPFDSTAKTKEYEVKLKEGKWRIAYKFGISVEELDALNPGISNNLQVGQVINVPNIADNEIRSFDESYEYYEVLPKEGFYRLKIKLGLSKEELEKLNPELEFSGLQAGMMLKIPRNTLIKTDSSADVAFNLADSINYFDKKHIVVMLPFKLHTVNSDSVYDAKYRIKNDRMIDLSLDFHSGILVALDSAKRLGISVKLDVYDTRNEVSETKNILMRNDFKDVNAVIGPLMKKNFEAAASILADRDIPIISPLTKEVKLYDNVFQSRPSTEMLQDRIVEYFKKDSLIKKVYIVHDIKSADAAIFLKRRFPNATVISSKLDESGEDLNYVLLDDFMIDKEEGINIFSEGKNIVFLETSDAGFASNVSSILNSLTSEEKQIILATTNKNSAFEGKNISNIYLSNLQFHFPSIRKDFDVENPDSFVQLYKRKFGYSPNKNAARGFDLAMDVLLRLSYAGNLFDASKLKNETVYSENKFFYKKKLFGGYYNNAAYIIKYKDLKIEAVD